MNRVSIRPAIESDLGRLREIMNQAITHSTAIWYEQTKSESDIRAWWEAKLAGTWPVFVGCLDHEVKGYATFGPFRPFDGYRFTVEHSVYIDPIAHRKGLGRGLLDQLIHEANRRRLHVMVGGIDATNHASLALHQQAGFIEVARMPEVGYKFDSWRTLIFMQKILATRPA
ncbi:GNAT family N-acetyltransferase [bacterium]|nr:GNAT family N-acetyltransferase [bacterium]